MKSKRNSISFFRRAALAACLFACVCSCKKDGGESEAPVAGAFTAVTESHTGEGKTELDGGKVLWERDDMITVYSSSSATPYGEDVDFYAVTAGESSEFEAAETLPGDFLKDGNSYAAVYPYDKCKFAISGNDTTFTVSIPSTQQYVKGGFASGANPMVAFAKESNVLPFKNVCGILRLQLCGVTPVSKITIEDKTSEGHGLWGDVTFKLTKGEPVLESVENGNKVMTLEVNDVYDDKNPDTYLDLNSTREFLVLLPAGSCEGGFEVTVYDPWGGTWSKQAMGAVNKIERSKIKTMNPVRAITSIAMYERDGKEVRWATVNMGAHAPWECGDYYAWGATETWYEQPLELGEPQTGSGTPETITSDWKNPATLNGGDKSRGYVWATARFQTASVADDDNGSNTKWEKYVPKDSQYSQYYSAGFSGDDKLELDEEDDAVHAVYGFPWRMPEVTGANAGDFYDLWHECSGEQPNPLPTYDDGHEVPGLRFQSKVVPGAIIFLPAAGRCSGTSRSYAGSYGYYWSRSLFSTAPYHAYYLYFNSGYVNTSFNYYRCLGFPVRPVL